MHGKKTKVLLFGLSSLGNLNHTLGFGCFSRESWNLCNEQWKPNWGPGEMGSLSRPEFPWLINRLGSRSSEFKTTLGCLLHCVSAEISAWNSALQTNCNKPVLFYLELFYWISWCTEHLGSHQCCCCKTCFAIRNDLNRESVSNVD